MVLKARAPPMTNDGAPPWTSATWTARIRSAVSEIRCQICSNAQAMAARPTRLPSSVGYRDLWLALPSLAGSSLRPTVLGSGSASSYDPNCSEVLRSAIGSGSPPRFPLHGPFAAGARGPEEAGPDRRCRWCLPVLTGSEDAARLGPGPIPPSGGHPPVSGEPEGARGSVSCSLAPFRWAPPP